MALDHVGLTATIRRKRRRDNRAHRPTPRMEWLSGQTGPPRAMFERLNHCHRTQHHRPSAPSAGACGSPMKGVESPDRGLMAFLGRYRSGVGTPSHRQRDHRAWCTISTLPRGYHDSPTGIAGQMMSYCVSVDQSTWPSFPGEANKKIPGGDPRVAHGSGSPPPANDSERVAIQTVFGALFTARAVARNRIRAHPRRPCHTPQGADHKDDAGAQHNNTHGHHVASPQHGRHRNDRPADLSTIASP